MGKFYDNFGKFYENYLLLWVLHTGVQLQGYRYLQKLYENFREIRRKGETKLTL